MPEQQQPQQKNTQSQKPPNASGTVGKTASGKPGTKQDQKQKTGPMDEDEETSACGPGTCS